MRRFAAVALREIAERRFVLVAAAVVSTFPILLPLLEKASGPEAVEERSISALLLCVGWGLAAALLVGASVVGRELAEKRLSFYFARPLPPAVIWGGKLAGGLALVLAVEVIILLPTALANGRIPAFSPSFLEAVPLAVILLVAVPFFLLAWAASVALRSRSPWLVVDLVFLGALPALLFLIVRRLLRYGHAPEPTWLVAALAVLLAALLLATLAQVVAGRTDARRGHGAQSLVLWGVLLAATAAGAVWAERTIDPGVDRLVRAWAAPGGRGGRWVFVTGSPREDGSGSTTYLLDLATGRGRLLPVGWGGLVSADGSREVHVTASPFSSKEIVLEATDLKAGGSVTLALPAWPEGLDLTPDGSRLAVVAQGLCSVHELPSLRLLASARVPTAPSWSYAPRFVDAGTVRLTPIRNIRSGTQAPERTPPAVVDPDAAVLNVATRSVSALARYPVTSVPLVSAKPLQGPATLPHFRFTTSPDLSRVLLVGFVAAHGVRLFDAASGRVLASFDGSEETGRPLALFLADGRVVVSEAAPEGRRLVVLSPDGSRLAEMALPAGTKHVRFGYESAKGSLAVGLGRDVTSPERDWYLVDLSSGRLKPLGVDALAWAFWNDLAPVPAPGSPATRLAWEKGTRRLVLFDPATGAQTPITRGKPTGK